MTPRQTAAERRLLEIAEVMNPTAAATGFIVVCIDDLCRGIRGVHPRRRRGAMPGL